MAGEGAGRGASLLMFTVQITSPVSSKATRSSRFLDLKKWF
jgi:hypothetical protein